MYIGRVSGTVVATIKDPSLAARKLLVVDRLTPEGQADGAYWIAVDSVQAGVGDVVLVLDEGNSARQVLNWEDAPVRAVVVGVVDQVTIGS